MWPYMIRLNPIGIAVFCFALICIYFLYSSSKMSTEQLMANSFLKRHNRHQSLEKEKRMDEINLKHILIAAIKVSEIGGKQVFTIRNSNDLRETSKGETKEGINIPLTEADLKSHRFMVNTLSLNFPGLRIVSEENHSDKNEETEAFERIRFEQHMFDDDIRHLPDSTVSMNDLVVWIDPLDATKEFTEHLLDYVTTMVCVVRHGKPIIGVVHKPFAKPAPETYWVWVDNGVSSTIENFVNARNVSEPNEPRVIVSRSHAGDVERLAKKAFGEKVQVTRAGGSGYKTIEVIKGNADVYVHTTAIKKWDVCAPNAIFDAVDGGQMTTLTAETITYEFQGDEEVDNGLLATLFDEESTHSKLVEAFSAASN